MRTLLLNTRYPQSRPEWKENLSEKALEDTVRSALEHSGADHAVEKKLAAEQNEKLKKQNLPLSQYMITYMKFLCSWVVAAQVDAVDRVASALILNGVTMLLDLTCMHGVTNILLFDQNMRKMAEENSKNTHSFDAMTFVSSPDLEKLQAHMMIVNQKLWESKMTQNQQKQDAENKRSREKREADERARGKAGRDRAAGGKNAYKGGKGQADWGPSNSWGSGGWQQNSSVPFDKPAFGGKGGKFGKDKGAKGGKDNKPDAEQAQDSKGS